MRKILVIDDDSDVRRTIREALRSRGYLTVEAASGLEGVAKAREQLPALVVSDINMDQGDGYSALEELRNDPATAAIPFILMTGQADAVGMRRGMELGADDYLPKPFKMETLLAAVEVRLKKQETVRRQAERKLQDLRASLCLTLPHEINTPLVGILSCGEIICSSADSLKPDDLGRLGRNIVDSGRRLHRLTQQFIAYAQIEHLSMDPSELEALRLDYAFNADQTISAVARSKAAAAGRTDDLKLRLTDSAVAMCPDFLTKLIEELVDNAFKFSATGTPVVINGFTWTDRFVLEVSDCGRGMSEDQLSEVAAFVQFQRRIYEQTGAGLGLAIAKRLIELHDGRFEIRSQINKGTCVSVALPIPNPGGSNLSPEEPFVRSPP